MMKPATTNSIANENNMSSLLSLRDSSIHAATPHQHDRRNIDADRSMGHFVERESVTRRNAEQSYA